MLVEIKEVFCVAVRGRPKNKSYKETEQRIELGSKEICCCLTTVQKDSMLL